MQELVKFHKGTIEVDSAVGQGTSFTVSVPLGRSHLPSDRIGGERTAGSTAVRAEAYVEEALRWLPGADEPALQQLARGAPLGSGAGRILLADDNADMRAYVSRLLVSQFEVQAVADGRAAIEAIRECKPDLVLADVMMPHLDGLGLVREIPRAFDAFRSPSASSFGARGRTSAARGFERRCRRLPDKAFQRPRTDGACGRQP